MKKKKKKKNKQTRDSHHNDSSLVRGLDQTSGGFQNLVCHCTLRRNKTNLYKWQSLVLIYCLKDLVPQYVMLTLPHEFHLISQPFSSL